MRKYTHMMPNKYYTIGSKLNMQTRISAKATIYNKTEKTTKLFV